MKCDRGHDRHFSSGIQSLHICRRVRLRIAKLRRFCQRRLKIHMILKHSCQDIVCRTVYDPKHLTDLICRKTLL